MLAAPALKDAFDPDYRAAPKFKALTYEAQSVPSILGDAAPRRAPPPSVGDPERPRAPALEGVRGGELQRTEGHGEEEGLRTGSAEKLLKIQVQCNAECALTYTY